MDRKKILNALADMISQEAEVTFDEDPAYTEICADFQYGEVSVFYLSNHNGLTVELVHNDYDRYYPNITEWIEKNVSRDDILDNCVVEDEWQAHGFRDEADYWHYKFS